MKLYKLENGVLEESPDRLVIYIYGEPTSIINPTDQQLRDAGYKPLSKQYYPILEWYETVSESYSDDADIIYLEYVVIPESNLLALYTEILATERDSVLENDFFWMGKCVKLNESNQRDYGIMYALLSNNKDAIPTFPCNFKNKTAHYFADYDELNDFGIATISFVNTQLTIFREETYKVKDYTNEQLYQYLKSL